MRTISAVPLDTNYTIKSPSYVSILYLLRRDILRCLGFNPDTDIKEHESIIWPAAMAVLSGIDLLGKFYAGNDSRSKVGERFREFVKKYIDNSNEEIIYQLRNSLLHSFGLISKTGNRVLHFNVTSHTDNLVIKQAEDVYKIDLLILWKKFEEGLLKYREELINDKLLQENFTKIFDEYGFIILG